MPLSEEHKALKERYQKHGLLLKGKGRSWEKDFTTKKAVWMFGVSMASHGGWDSLTASGWVHTNLLALTKARVFAPGEDRLFSCWNLVIGPIFVQFARMPK